VWHDLRMTGAIHFLLNGVKRRVTAVTPAMTVLQYLREREGMVGTKEGCAEGDCGACTVVVSRVEDGRPAYHAVNSCLLLLPQLDGAAVFTVEGLADQHGELHPVQQALLEHDGTQCGYCTPGIVMSMAAFQQSGEPVTDDHIHEMLSGNLCRCTGYRSIVAACHRVAEDTAGTALAPLLESPSLLDSLPPCADYRDDKLIFLTPRSLTELAEVAAQYPQAQFLAGGTDLGLHFSKHRKEPTALISTSRVAELKRIAVGADAIEFGGAVTYSEALPHLDEHLPQFADLVRRIGSRQIRNLGTIAGNLANASPIGDTPPCLIALEAVLTLRSSSGARTVTAESFITGYRKTVLQPGEFIEAIRVPRLRPNQQFFAYKISKRFDQDISTTIGAFRIEVQNAVVRDLRAVFGGMAAQPARAACAEKAVSGRPWTAETLAGIDAEVARDFSPIDDHRGTAAYRLRAAANLFRRLQLETTVASPVRLELL
jgi:xanthine dehydrogenase small subunit